MMLLPRRHHRHVAETARYAARAYITPMGPRWEARASRCRHAAAMLITAQMLPLPADFLITAAFAMPRR